jgi:hypothetical protein
MFRLVITNKAAVEELPLGSSLDIRIAVLEE